MKIPVKDGKGLRREKWAMRGTYWEVQDQLPQHISIDAPGGDTPLILTNDPLQQKRVFKEEN